MMFILRFVAKQRFSLIAECIISSLTSWVLCLQCLLCYVVYRRGSAVVSSARAIQKFKLLSFKSLVSILTKLVQFFEENKKETRSYASKTIKTRSCPTYQGASVLRVVIYVYFDHKKESSLLQYRVLVRLYVVWCSALSLPATERCIPLSVT